MLRRNRAARKARKAKYEADAKEREDRKVLALRQKASERFLRDALGSGVKGKRRSLSYDGFVMGHSRGRYDDALDRAYLPKDSERSTSGLTYLKGSERVTVISHTFDGEGGIRKETTSARSVRAGNISSGAHTGQVGGKGGISFSVPFAGAKARTAKKQPWEKRVEPFSGPALMPKTGLIRNEEPIVCSNRDPLHAYKVEKRAVLKKDGTTTKRRKLVEIAEVKFHEGAVRTKADAQRDDLMASLEVVLDYLGLWLGYWD